MGGKAKGGAKALSEPCKGGKQKNVCNFKYSKRSVALASS